MAGKPYEVHIKKKARRRFSNLPLNTKKMFGLLVADLEETGPIQNQWKNYSPLGEGKHHCHLSWSYVACWSHEEGSIIIEVYYVGSREDAPY